MIAVEISLILCPCSLTTENPEGVSPFMCFTMGFLHVLMVTRCRRGNMNKHSKKHMIPLNPTKSHLKHQRVISKKNDIFPWIKTPFSWSAPSCCATPRIHHRSRLVASETAKKTKNFVLAQGFSTSIFYSILRYKFYIV